VALRPGFVIVGNLPTTDGTSSTASAGCFIVLSNNDQLATTLLAMAYAGDGRRVETTPDGKPSGVSKIDVSHSRNAAGTLFGLAVFNQRVYFVDDGNNTPNLSQ
jgi:hypothetical protein